MDAGNSVLSISQPMPFNEGFYVLMLHLSMLNGMPFHFALVLFSSMCACHAMYQFEQCPYASVCHLFCSGLS